MVFSSSTFLLVFLPAFLLLYFAVPSRTYRNTLLLIASLVFYAWGEPVYIGLMIVSIVGNWCLAQAIDRARRWSRPLLAVDLSINLAVLGFFKYQGFLAENINLLLGTNMPVLDLPLPIGISFYTLQAVSYVVDVYRQQVPAQKNLLYLGMYIAMFPQLVAGPIVRYSTIQDQILNRKENLSDFCSGARLFVVGLGKKVLLANIVAILATKMLAAGGSEIGLIGAWAGLLAFTFQIYFDFAGYSDMAIGLGRMLGFQYLRNFNYPYISKSITEFWRRWHISLSSFFRDYVYISLGGNRVSKPRWILNLSVVWFLTGFWHGAAWNYILWGLFYLAILLLEKLVWGKALAKLPSVLQHMYTIFVVMLAWMLFWIEDMSVMGEYLLAMLGQFGLTGSMTFWELGVWAYVPVFLVCLVASIPVVPWTRSRISRFLEKDAGKDSFWEKDLPSKDHLSTNELCTFALDVTSAGRERRLAYYAIAMAVDLFLLVVLSLSVMAVVSGSFNPFIYFRF